jgi:hypothetical protein
VEAAQQRRRWFASRLAVTSASSALTTDDIFIYFFHFFHFGIFILNHRMEQADEQPNVPHVQV